MHGTAVVVVNIVHSGLNNLFLKNSKIKNNNTILLMSKFKLAITHSHASIHFKIKILSCVQILIAAAGI